MTDIERFELPRDDWYDSEGRIYKDVLIENLDACEQKLLELQQLDAFVVTPPDFSTIVYPDTTLASDDNCIINLRSFLNMVDIVNYPIELNISGVKIRRIAFWDINYNYIVIENTTVSTASDSTPYVYIDTSDNEIKATANPNTAISNIFLGVYENEKIRGVYENPKANLNLMYLLANMQKDTGSKSFALHNFEVQTNALNTNRAVGFKDGESKSGSSSYTYTDYGRGEEE